MIQQTRQAGAEVEVTPQMISAGVDFCRSEFQWTDKRASEMGYCDMVALLCAVFGEGLGVCELE